MIQATEELLDLVEQAKCCEWWSRKADRKRSKKGVDLGQKTVVGGGLVGSVESSGGLASPGRDLTARSVCRP